MRRISLGLLSFAGATLPAQADTQHTQPILGLVVDGAGKPVPDASVEAWDVLHATHIGKPAQSRPALLTVTSDAQGQVLLRGIPARGATLRIRAPGYYQARLAYASAATLFRVEMRRAPRVTGRVVDVAGRGVPARISFQYELGEAFQWFETGVDGRFSRLLEHPGRFLVLYAAGEHPLKSEVMTADGPDLEIALELDATFRHPARLRLKLGSEGSGDASVPSRVSLTCVPSKAGGDSKPRTVALRRIPGLPSSFYLPAVDLKDGTRAFVTIEAPQHAPLNIAVESFHATGESVLAGVMRPEAMVQGTVVTAGGEEPVPFARVRIVRIGKTEPAPIHQAMRAQTDAQGRFHFRGFAPGTYELRATRVGAEDEVTTRVQLSPGRQDSPVKIVLRQGVAVTGRVTSSLPGGVPGGATVSLRASEGPARDMRPVRAPLRESRFRFDDVPPGEYDLLVHVPLGRGRGSVVAAALPLGGVPRDKRVNASFEIGSWLLLGEIAGKVDAAGAGMPFHRLLVTTFSGEELLELADGRIKDARAGAVSGVAPDGSYRLYLPVHLPNDSLPVRVIDLSTGVELHRTETRHPEGGTTTKQDLDLTVAPVRLSWAPEDAEKPGLRASRLFWRNDGTRQWLVGGKRGGLHLDPWQRELKLWLPCRENEFELHTCRDLLGADRQARGAGRITPRPDAPNRLRIEATED